MPPNRRKKSKKHRLNAANGVADDDVFEVDDKPIKKRYKASSAIRQNLRSGDKPTATNTTDKKHVDVKQKNSLDSDLKSKSSAIITFDSEEVRILKFFVENESIYVCYLPRKQSDFEMDIGPRVIKPCTKQTDAEAGEPQPKRQKVCDESSNEKGDDASEKSAPSVTDEPPPTPVEEKNSAAKVT